MRVFERLTFRDNPALITAKGLGQILKTATRTSAHRATFCSKWIFSDGSNIHVTRDYLKTLTKRQYYTKQNADIVTHPSTHAAVMLQGLAAEQSSLLLESFMHYRVWKHGAPKEGAQYKGVDAAG